MNPGVSKGDLAKDSKALQKTSEQESKAGEFQGRAKVWLNIKNFTLPQGLTPKFMAKFARPFPVVKQMFDDTYKLALPPEIKVHLMFHVLLLKEYIKSL